MHLVPEQCSGIGSGDGDRDATIWTWSSGVALPHLKHTSLHLTIDPLMSSSVTFFSKAFEFPTNLKTTSSMSSVIIFGPTGQIGSIAAKTAGEQGAKVWLGMRDVNKTIPRLDDSTSGTFQRVKADLQEPKTVKEAVETSGARRAFIYYAHGSPDNMRATIEALKSGGVTFVVFISSFTVYIDKPLRETSDIEYIPYVHAQVEANLEDVFGAGNYVPLRCGAFASNLLGMKDQIAAGKVSLYGGVFEQDNIDPADIGRVAGTILVSGLRNGQKIVYVYGPKILSLQDSVAEIGRVIGKDVQIILQSREEALQERLNEGMPEHIATYLVDVLDTPGPDKGKGERFPNYNEGVQNIKLYSGKEATPFAEWVNENKAKFVIS